MEHNRATLSNDALIGRIEKIESGSVNRESIDGLKALEKALGRTLQQFETIREETLARVEASEVAIEGLTERVDVIDTQLRDAIVSLRENVDEVNGQISITERTVAMVLEEARLAAQSQDEAFIERTSNKMRILGNEIKRTSDRIQSIDDKIARLAEQIDASEQRSADGINQISKTVAALSTELAAFDESQGDAVSAARQAIETATQDADDRLSTLKSSFDTMLRRIEGIADGERAGQAAALAAASPAATASPADDLPPPVAEPDDAALELSGMEAAPAPAT
ncbi:hypothetical protein, partial [uncultured Nitratireductor sp.]|uniref:hypothetical protein n=1 Tax=uncultured Nitratireductor sp. TaxID=520953 RepID=UPI0025F1ACD0